MTDLLNLFKVPRPAEPVYPHMEDFLVLDVFHSFGPAGHPDWQLAVLVGVEPHAAPFDEEERQWLMRAALALNARFGPEVSNGERHYGDARVSLSRGNTFVYLTLLFWPGWAARH